MQTAKAIFHVAHPPDLKGPCSEFPNRPDQAAINDATPPFDSAAYPAGGRYTFAVDVRHQCEDGLQQPQYVRLPSRRAVQPVIRSEPLSRSSAKFDRRNVTRLGAGELP